MKGAPLTAKFVQNISSDGRYGDGRGGFGLSLLVKRMSNGRHSKSWSQRIRVNGKPVMRGLGSYPAVTLAEARKRALANARMLQEGADPFIKDDGIPTFEQAAESVIGIHAVNWKDGGKTEKSWQAVLRDYAFPSIGDMQVSSITSQHVMEILLPIWSTKRATAKKLKHRVSAVMAWAMSEGYRTDNPVMVVGAALPKNGVQLKHMRALPYSEVSKAIQMVRKSPSYDVTKLCLEFTVLTACRSGEVRGAQWGEFDLDNATWTIPADRMKMRKQHKVPLSKRCIEILEQIEEMDMDSELVFPSVRGKEFSDNTLSKLLRDNSIESTVHGFRSSFRDWAAEKSNAPREISEFCLAHVEGSSAELAYRRTDYFAKRCSIMQNWADYLESDE